MAGTRHSINTQSINNRYIYLIYNHSHALLIKIIAVVYGSVRPRSDNSDGYYFNTYIVKSKFACISINDSREPAHYWTLFRNNAIKWVYEWRYLFGVLFHTIPIFIAYA